ncbi:HEPN domain-containing protein [Nocardia sp. A7]|uniref:HEPN domain-containing protein n=1 Tax=Nocardia sp. A7 TaxID=2789274 RepID=UPI00397A6CA4
MPVAIGQFWIAGYGSSPQRGTLTYLPDGSKPTLRVDGPIVESDYFGTVEQQVESFAPRTILGCLESGDDVTLLSAQGKSDPFGGAQEFSARHLVIGVHLKSGTENSFIGIRLLLGPKSCWRHLGGTAHQFEMGELLAVESQRGMWLEFNGIAQTSIQQLNINIKLAVRVLIELATTSRAAGSAIEYRSVADGPWLQVFTAERRDQEFGVCPDPLSLRRLLTLQRFASWIEACEKLDGLALPVGSLPDSVPIESQVLTYVSVAEGLHRRLADRPRFPGLTGARIAKIRREARKAGTAQFIAADDQQKADMDKFFADVLNEKIFNQLPYGIRIEELLKCAQEAVPDIVSTYPDWLKAVKDTRNRLAHQLEWRDRLQSDTALDRMIAVSTSLRWVLRVVLLRVAGLGDDELRAGIQSSDFYRFYLSNLKQLSSLD